MKLVALAILLTTSCGAASPLDSESETMTASPWHMWGSNATIQQLALSPGLLLQGNAQLTQVDYKRPESWRFFFMATLLQIENGSPAPLDVFFDLTFGVGRSMVKVPSFEHFQFDITAGTPQSKWSSTVLGPPRIQATADQNVTDTLVAQSIQVEARVRNQATVVSDGFTVEVYSFFGPVNHIRPEWFIEHFPGGEQNGR